MIRPLRTCPEIHGESGLDGHEYVDHDGLRGDCHNVDLYRIPALPEGTAPLPVCCFSVVYEVGLVFGDCCAVTSQGKAVNVMADRILSAAAATGDKITLLATGCLTNVALLLTVYPEVKDVLDNIGVCCRILVMPLCCCVMSTVWLRMPP
jgi:Inosine-uridine preferring nucleoside hydrolase